MELHFPPTCMTEKHLLVSCTSFSPLDVPADKNLAVLVACVWIPRERVCVYAHCMTSLQTVLFGRLIGLCKKIGGATPILAPGLKFGKVFVDRFLKLTPLLGASFGDPTGRAVQILKEVQTTTRTLQMICSHTKVQQNAALFATIPGLKKAMEELVYRMKLIFNDNECGSVFSIGNLKNKEIASARQSKRPRDNDDQDEE